MQAFTTLRSVVIPLDRSNVDTDAIIPKQYLKSVKRSGFGPNLFDQWRYLDSGAFDQDHSARAENPQFVLNQPAYRNAQILLTRQNFGCGSSREHAVWALMDWGIRVVVAPSFADIFHSNCLKNGLLPVVLAESQVAYLFAECAKDSAFAVTVNLENQSISIDDEESFPFEIDAFRRQCLLQGLDEIGLTLQHADDIRAYEMRRRREAPWLFDSTSRECK